MKRLVNRHRITIHIEPPVAGRVHVQLMVGSDQVIAAELVSEVAHASVCEWLRIAMADTSDVEHETGWPKP